MSVGFIMIFSTAARGRTAILSTLFAIGLSACSSDNPTGEFLESSGLGPKVAPRADFVERSRPQSLDYMTIGTADPGRATAPRTLAEVKAAEAELDAERDRNMARGTAAANLGGTPPPPPVVVPAAAPAKKPAPKRP
jgi:hypothetical protein